MSLPHQLGAKTGTLGGTLLTVIVNIGSGDLLRTAILAMVGAVVSYAVTQILQRIVRWIKNRTPTEH